MDNFNNTFDFELTVQRVGGKRSVAKEIIDSFILEYLPEHVHDIRQAIASYDLQLLIKAVHKFHGAVCYCGTLNLENMAAKLETAIKKKKSKEHINKSCNNLLKEIEKVSKAYSDYFSKKN